MVSSDTLSPDMKKAEVRLANIDTDLLTKNPLIISVREVTRTPDLPLRSGFVTQKSKERRAFPCPDFRCHPLCHPTFETVGLEANGPEKKHLY